MVANKVLGFSRSFSTSRLLTSLRDSRSSMSAGWREKNAVSLLEIKAEAMRSRHNTTNPMMALTVNPVKKLFETTVSSPMRGSGSGVSKAVCFMFCAAKLKNYSDMHAIIQLRTANRFPAHCLGTGRDALILRELDCIPRAVLLCRVVRTTTAARGVPAPVASSCRHSPR